LVHQSVPLSEGKFWVAGGESGEKLCFPGLDCVLSGVAVVDVGRDELELDVVFFECFLELVGAFVVEYV
jgi:hypothetical protein